MRVQADTDRCIGSGSCAMNAPDVFDQRAEDGLVVVLDPSPPAEMHEDVRVAARFCPTSAINVEEHSNEVG